MKVKTLINEEIQYPRKIQTFGKNVSKEDEKLVVVICSIRKNFV